MKVTQLILLLVACIGAAAWAYSRPGWDSYVALLGALGALSTATIFWRARRPATGAPKQSQTVACGGIGIQAGRGVTIGGKRDAENE
ncbi:MAG: hypothetical protein AAGC76_05135 [Luteibacter sp.]|uniref:hypothetical protein n=1 Tax=Luteibacter sp. TaxID=1886636 RepID=UPI002807883F|nr:hypothetical protein [Luteibacter sp.]MDQ7995221.1 hypothetical protein [Luteibacter sp.]